MTSTNLWSRFQKYFIRYEDIGFSLDVSRVNFSDDFLIHMTPRAAKAHLDMLELEKGAIANPDENRMVGHYWLRDSSLAPSEALCADVENTKRDILEFAADVHSGKITGASDKKISQLLLIGIGGSALGPQLVADALWTPSDPVAVHFFDNTDPDGMNKVLEQLDGKLDETLVAVVSKSGGTKESRNGMLTAQNAFEKAGIDFAKHAVAVTGKDSLLDKTAVDEGWLRRFPMFDWIGGRTSVMSAVGLLPMALQGIDVEALLAGAKAMDTKTRGDDLPKNAAMMLALMWYATGDGKGKKDMVILPYKDRLLLFSRYLQQLVMESLGKKLDLDGEVVHQGIAVYGNKGSTDQHAYVQQLRDGVNNFFATFIQVEKSSSVASPEVESGVDAGDYLQGFLRGTRAALYESDRESITISISEFNAFQLGSLIALYERAVGFYGSLVNINAYHQPGVEAGKKAAERILQLQAKALAYLKSADNELTAEQVALAIECDPEEAFHILTHAAANRDMIEHVLGKNISEDTFKFIN
ncbi:MAG: glucose-6-phosphate isomerase [Chthoniobacterales bacterium]